MTNLALIGSRSSLNTGKSWWTQDLPSNSLNWFTNRLKVNVQREEHWYLKEIQREKRGPFDLKKIGWMTTVARTRWGMIPRRGPMFSLSFRQSDEDRTVGMSPRVAPRRANSAINSERSILIVESWCVQSSLTRSTAPFSARAPDEDGELLATPRVFLDVVDHFT